MMRIRKPALVIMAATAVALPVSAQVVEPSREMVSHPKIGGSQNVKIMSHIPLGGFFQVSDIELEQEMERPYAYVSQMLVHGFTIVDLKDPEKAKVLYRFRIENAPLHQGTGGMDGKYFKHKGKYYYVQSFQFGQGGPDSDLGAIVFDVTGLPDATKVKEVARIRDARAPGGFHNIFAYKHSSGRPLLVTTVGANRGNIYDLDRVVAGGDPAGWLIGEVPVPQSNLGPGGYHDFYVGYDPATRKDKLYAAGVGGYHVFDITGPEKPELLFSISGAAGVNYGHTFTPSPDGSFAVTETEYQYAPLRIFDLREAQAGRVRNINRPVGAWTADWRALSHNHEVRWPYVFVSAYEDGLQIFNMADPSNPITVGWYYTFHGAHMTGWGGTQNPRGTSVMNGAFGVDVRNADGLVVLSDTETGFWAFRMDGFTGWSGEQWGMPNISSVQDWDRGPAGTATAVTTTDAGGV
jgi:hypothetical protein